MLQNFSGLSVPCRSYYKDLIAVGCISCNLATSAQRCCFADILPLLAKVRTMQQYYRSRSCLADTAWHTRSARVQIRRVAAYSNQRSYTVAFQHQLPLATGRYRTRLEAAMLSRLRKDEHAYANHKRDYDNGSETGQPSFASRANSWMLRCWLSTWRIVILRLHRLTPDDFLTSINRCFIGEDEDEDREVPIRCYLP
jgi:hypothetical protein